MIRPTLFLRDDEEALDVLRALFLINVGQIRHRLVPRLYTSGVRYQREPRGREDWQDALTTYQRRNGDCEDLACWRAAEAYVLDGDRGSRPMIKRIHPGLEHCLVLHGDGTIEDPSAKLGMYGKG